MEHLTIATQITNREESPALQKYLDEIARYPLLSIEEEVELFNKLDLLNSDNKKLPDQLNEFDEKTQGNIKKVVEKISRANLRFVVSVAKQYQQKNIELLDLINEGSIGLVKAIYRFDYTKGFKFISYAVWWIRQSILQHLQENKLIRYPANRGVYVNKINKFIRHFQQINLRLPEDNEVCEGCNITQEDYERYLAVTCSKKISLDSKINPDEDDSKTIGETATLSQYSSIPSPDSGIMKQTEINRLLELRLHSDNEMLYKYAFVCVLKFGLNPGGINPDGIGIEHTDEEIVEKFLERGLFIKTESVRSLFDRAKKKLATILTPDGEIREEYKVYMEKLKANNPISDIFIKYSKEKITQAVEQLSEKKGTETQAKVFSLKYGICSKFNPDGKKYTIEEIAGQLKRREGSVNTTLNSAIEKIIDKLQNSPSQLEITPMTGNSIPDSNIPEPLSNIPGCDITNSKVYTEPRDSSDLNYRKEKVGQALKIFNNQKTKKEEDQYKAISLYSGLNKDGIAYSGKSFADKLERSYPQSAFTTLKTAEKKVAKILGIDLSKMKEILENLNTSNRSAISDVLSNTPEETITKQIDTSDVDYRREKIIESLPKLKEKRLLGSKKGIDKIKYDKGEVLRLYSGINPDGSVGKAYNNKEISESLGITYTYTPKVLTAAKRDVADILRIKLDDLEKILKNLRKSNKADIKQVLEEPQSEVQDSPQNIDSFDPKEPQNKPPEAQNIPKSEIPTDHQKEASIPTKITDIPDVIDLESKIKTALEELRQEIENEHERGKNKKRNGCDVLNLYYFGVDPDDGKLYSNDKIANQLGISAGTYVSIILKKTKTRLAEKLGIDTDTLADILKKLRKSNNADIKQVLEEPEKEFPDAQNIPQSEVPTDPQKNASIPTKNTDIPDVINLESKIKTALEELRQEIENEHGRGKNKKRNGCDVLNLYYFGVDPDDGKLYSNDKIANQLGISAGTYVSTILKKTKTRLAEKLGIDTDTLTDILKKLRERNRDDIKNILEQPRENTENLKQ